MIKKLLIANRGEIACRIIRTAKKMGIETVAVYSEADTHAMHARMADVAVNIGKPAAKESYLNGEKIIRTAIALKADAIHPGYGFLSENPSFATDVEKAGLTFIGAPAKAIATMGSKSRAKQIMAAASVPLIPGYEASDNNDQSLIKAASSMEYPLLLKASAGGGGKGMRIVYHQDELPEALNSARREAESAFGDSQMIIERYIKNSRHVEVQVFFDQKGNGVYLFDRDCSLQRRYQKVIEEAPAPGLEPSLHKAMGETAVQAGLAVGYVGAGTVEFLLDEKHRFYFMEMNTRLQVEHPVTEMITRTDLVEWQIRIANGEILPAQQDQLKIHGHAVEARLYAEEPEKQFSPATGHLNYLDWPVEDKSLRIETGVVSGDVITPWYDPMIAKIVTWGIQREEAINRLIKTLGETCICGVPTNRDFLISLLARPEVLSAQMTTSFIDNKLHSLLTTDKTVFYIALAAATFYSHYRHHHESHYKDRQIAGGWRMNAGLSAQSLWISDYLSPNELLLDNVLPIKKTFHVKMEKQKTEWEVFINNEKLSINHFSVSKGKNDDFINIKIKEAVYQSRIIEDTKAVTVISSRHTFSLAHPEYFLSEATEGSLTAPMNGIISSVNVFSGSSVEKNDILITLEAMKMEISIRAPKAGVIERIFFSTGNTVNEGDILLAYAEEGK